LSLGQADAGVEDLKMAVEVGKNQPFYKQWVDRSRTLLSVRQITIE
jgi:hypothetical protein